MKDIFAVIGKILGLVFAAGVIAFTGWMTMKLGQRLIPGDALMQWMILVLFDGAALVWFFQFITQAKGTAQWAFAGVGWMIGLAGAIIMTAGELVLGQKLVTIDDPTRFGWIIIATVVVAALAHAVLIYLFHFSDPAMRNRIENAQKVSKAIETAYSNARQQIDNNVDQLTEGLIASAIHEAQQQINHVTAYHIRSAARLEAKAGVVMRGGPVVDGQSRDAAPSSTEQPKKRNKRGLFDLLNRQPQEQPQTASRFIKLDDLPDLLLKMQADQRQSSKTAQVYQSETTPPPDVVDPINPPAK